MLFRVDRKLKEDGIKYYKAKEIKVEKLIYRIN